MNDIEALAKLSGALAVAVGIIGYGIDLEDVVGDLSSIKVLAILFFFLALEFVLHQVALDSLELHQLIHAAMALTAFSAGIYGLQVLRRQPIKFNVGRFKELLVYGSLIWLLNKNINLAEYPSIYFVLFALSLFVAAISFYVVTKIAKLKAFFIVDKNVVICAYFVVAMIGLSALNDSCILPLFISAIVEFYLFYVLLKIAEPLIR